MIKKETKKTIGLKNKSKKKPRILESILGPKNRKAGANHSIKQVGKLASSGKDAK